MKRVVSFLVIVVLWTLVVFDSHAEVRVHGQELTAHLGNTSLASVLMKIGQQAGIDIAVLNGSGYHQAVVSEVLENVPLEQGLDRLLNGWNYGLIKNSTTGVIQTVMIVSKRTGAVEPHPLVAQVQIISNRLEQEDSDHNGEGLNSPDLPDETKYLTDEDLLKNALPEVRELIQQMQRRIGEE